MLVGLSSPLYASDYERPAVVVGYPALTFVKSQEKSTYGAVVEGNGAFYGAWNSPKLENATQSAMSSCVGANNTGCRIIAELVDSCLAVSTGQYKPNKKKRNKNKRNEETRNFWSIGNTLSAAKAAAMGQCDGLSSCHIRFSVCSAGKPKPPLWEFAQWNRRLSDVKRQSNGKARTNADRSQDGRYPAKLSIDYNDGDIEGAAYFYFEEKTNLFKGMMFWAKDKRSALNLNVRLVDFFDAPNMQNGFGVSSFEWVRGDTKIIFLHGFSGTRVQYSAK